MKPWQGIVLVLIGVWLLVVASKRPFWDDERWVFTDLKAPSLRLLLDGAPQECSPAPLFYLLLKPWAVDEAALVRGRVISIVSACLVLGLVWHRGVWSPEGSPHCRCFSNHSFSSTQRKCDRMRSGCC
jgi:hypothetical protein